LDFSVPKKGTPEERRKSACILSKIFTSTVTINSFHTFKSNVQHNILLLQ